MADDLEKILGYKFKNKNLLNSALTHASFSSDLNKNYERLEFLGDRVLSVAVASLLYKKFDKEPEGSLSQRLTALVCKECVAEVALSLELDKYMRVANEEIRHNENVLCDVCEAIIGAIFIDSDISSAIDFVHRNWKSLLDKNLTPPKDAKTALQEIAHVKGLSSPVYEIIDREGSEHEPVFSITVSVGNMMEIGKGKSKKLAEQEAAAKLLKALSG
jgi:ribonuclease-3